MNFRIGIVCATLWIMAMPCARADDSADVERLKQAKALLDAQAARDNAEAVAIKAAADLAKARAAAANASNEIRKAQFDAQAASTAAEVAAQAATATALKAAFGAPPAVGSDGSIAITDASGGVLLQTKAGSLDATWQLAQSLCVQLAAAGIEGAYIAPVDLDTKVQSSRMVLRDFLALSEKVRRPENRDLVGLSGVQAQVAPAAILSGVTLLEYGAGALQQVAKLFRSDYAVALSADATRAGWLEYFMAARCPAVLPFAQIETVVRRQSLDEIVKRLDEMQDFSAAAAVKKGAFQKQVEVLTARIAELKAKKEDASVVEAQLKAQNEGLATLAPLDAWLPRIQVLMASVTSNAAAFLDAIAYIAFSSDQAILDGLLSKEVKALALGTKPRLNVVLTTQDGQVTSTFWLTGKKVYGRSAAELIYRVTASDGKLAATGYLTANSSGGQMDFSAKHPVVVDATHNLSMARSPSRAGAATR
jgi:hypothetical protein